MDRMSTLPTIKCSTCGVEISILQLADHVCVTSSPTATLLPAPTAPNSQKLNRAATFGGPSFSARSDRLAPSSRMPPPSRIDSNAANKPFRPLEPSLMTSYNDTRTRSPPSAAQPPKSPFKMNRSVTTPNPRSKAPTSPDLTSNMDCPFPPFRNKPATPKSAKARTRDRLGPTDEQNYAAPSPLFAPLSPRTNGGENVTRRMDTIAPGPFDGRRPSTSSASISPARGEPNNGHRRTNSQDSTRSNGSTRRQRTSLSSNASHSSAYSNRSAGLPSRPIPSMNGANSYPPPPLLPPTEQSEGIDAFLDRLKRETLKPSQTGQDSIARPVDMQESSKERWAAPPRPRRPSENDLAPKIPEDMLHNGVPHPGDRLPVSEPGRSGAATDVRQDAAPSQSLRPPPLVPSTFGTEAHLTSLHTPSDSGLSDDSYASSSFRSTASSRSSPAGSEVGHSRDVSKISRFNYIPEESVERTTSPDSYAESRPGRGPGSYTRPNGPEPIPQARSRAYDNIPESPMDPAIQKGASFNSQSRDPITSRGPSFETARSPPRRMADRGPSPVETRRPKPTNKGNCRGCSEPIVGKSVKDSSGRLTGRYHKQCFVCRTCADPFPTADFYVFENFPYCEQHYHKLNGSLCGSCNRGIEGQYLETDMRQKFHPRCFTCTACRIVLRDGYFEVGGQRYCDRHAQRAAAPPQNYLGPGGYKPRNLQKRGTRLMMMT